MAGLLLIFTGGCKAGRRPSEPAQEQRLEQPASGAQMGVELLNAAKPKGTGFRFCWPGDTKADPEIVRAVLARVGPMDAAAVGCEVVARDGHWLGKEWIVGSVPSGGSSPKCDPLLPGEYELYLYGRRGDAARRFLVHADGTTEFARWDRQSRLPRPDECGS